MCVILQNTSLHVSDSKTLGNEFNFFVNWNFVSIFCDDCSVDDFDCHSLAFLKNLSCPMIIAKVKVSEKCSVFEMEGMFLFHNILK